MRRSIVAAALSVAWIGACEMHSDEVTQEVAGPSGVAVTVRAVDQLAVSWTAVPTAWKYYVFQGAAGAPLAYVASVTGSPPATSYIATGIASGASYCFAVSAVFPDNSESSLSASVCSGGGGPPLPALSGTLVLSPHSFIGLFGTTVVHSQNATMQGGTAIAAASLPLPVGATITGVRIAVTDSHSPTSQAAIALSSTTAGGQEIDLATAPISNASGSSQILATGALSVIALPTTSYWIAVKTVNGNGPVVISGAAIDYQ